MTTLEAACITECIFIMTFPRIIILVDGLISGNFPFGTFFPTGSFTPALFISRVPSSRTGIVHPGVTLEGFRGCVRELRVRGRRLDYMESVGVQSVNLGMSADVRRSDVYSFNGSGFAKRGRCMCACAHFEVENNLVTLQSITKS